MPAAVPAEVADGTIEDLESIESMIEMDAERMLGHLHEVHRRKLYLLKAKSWDQYLAARWNIGRSRGYQLLRGYDVQRQIADARPNGKQPNMAQAEALSKVPKANRVEAWDEAQDAAKKNGKPVTAVTVKRVVAGEKNAPAKDDTPWAQFELDVDDILTALRSVSRKMNAAFKADPNTKQLKEKWAQFIPHTGTIGAVNAIVRVIESNMPAEVTDKAPGFLPVRTVQMRNRTK
jgi:hypothetical protein